MRYFFLACHLLGGLLLLNCSKSAAPEPVFVPLSAEESGITFTNTLQYTEELNPYTFKNFYNGGGVAIGDINNDGLSDIFIGGNMVSNKLYLNQGNLKFQDITREANLESSGTWSTGVSLVDINADGFLDIYVCKSGPPGGDKRYNELFINNGDLTFTEQASQFGLDNLGLSVHAAFFDYDKDGDLDCYLLNNSIKSIGSFDMAKDQRLIPDSLGGNKLFRNDDGYFNDVTLASGIYSSEIGFGLGATVGDINDDNWPDIYISNDFFEKDYLYINQHDGTFKDLLEDYIKEISMGSMGADLADINNDGYPEYFVTEMLPESRSRLVTKTFFESWHDHKNSQAKGYCNQFGRNVLQLNNADGTFSEIGRYAGVEATDWSWSSLIFDADNDGLKDIFVSNGIYKDLLDLDYLNFANDHSRVRQLMATNENAIQTMIDMMPSEPVPNYIFHNNGDFTFTNKAATWGMGQPTFSNGSAYGDLDRDGDLDLVVNNLNTVSQVYENRSEQVYPENNFLALTLQGDGKNINAIGTKVRIFIGNEVLYQELNPMRGFESTVDYKLIFGLGRATRIDSIQVVWPSDRVNVLYNAEPNQLIELQESDAHEPLPEPAVGEDTSPMFTPYSNESLSFTHVENPYVDFEKDRLLFHMNSTEGPCICKGDVNHDQLEDLYIGGASGQPGALFIQLASGRFEKVTEKFKPDSQSEDLDCAFFDANGDGHQDLYVCSGGSEFGSISVWLNDRLYFGDGTGSMTKSDQRLPFKGFESTSTVLPMDFDKDGDQDLFVGGRSVPYYYGVPADSYLLENLGNGNYTPLTNGSDNIFSRLGMVTDATLADLDKDGSDELVVIGRWMPVTIFKNSNGTWSNTTAKWGLETSNGWYNTVEAADLNHDGYPDLLVGNHGLNTRFKASYREPLELLVNDFDNNGSYEQVISMYIQGKQYPFVQLKELASQLPSITQVYSSFKDYQQVETAAIFSEEMRADGFISEAYNLATGMFINESGRLVFKPLPMRAQLSPVYAFEINDFNKDGNTDILLGGNFSESKPEAGTYQASFGSLFTGDGGGGFTFIPNVQASFYIEGNIRDSESIRIDKKQVLVFTRNDSEIFSIEYHEPK